METFRIPARISEDKKLIVESPMDIPSGLVDLMIVLKEEASHHVPTTWAKQRALVNHKLKLARRQPYKQELPDSYVPLSDTERMRLSVLPSNAQPTAQLIDADRGPR